MWLAMKHPLIHNKDWFLKTPIRNWVKISLIDLQFHTGVRVPQGRWVLILLKLKLTRETENVRPASGFNRLSTRPQLTFGNFCTDPDHSLIRVTISSYVIKVNTVNLEKVVNTIKYKMLHTMVWLILFQDSTSEFYIKHDFWEPKSIVKSSISRWKQIFQEPI